MFTNQNRWDVGNVRLVSQEKQTINEANSLSPKGVDNYQFGWDTDEKIKPTKKKSIVLKYPLYND